MASEAVKKLLEELEEEAKSSAVNPQCTYLLSEIEDLEQQLDKTTNQAQRLSLAIKINALEQQYRKIGCAKLPVY